MFRPTWIDEICKKNRVEILITPNLCKNIESIKEDEIEEIKLLISENFNQFEVLEIFWGENGPEIRIVE